MTVDLVCLRYSRTEVVLANGTHSAEISLIVLLLLTGRTYHEEDWMWAVVLALHVNWIPPTDICQGCNCGVSGRTAHSVSIR